MHVPLDARQLGQHLQHVHGQPDRPRGVGEPALDRLPDPPHRVRGELVALAVVKLLDRADQAQVAFLHDVKEGQPAVAVLLGDRHHQPEVGLQHVRLGPPPVLGDKLQVTAEVRRQVRLGVQLVLGEQARLNALGEVDLLLGGEQAGPADGLQVRVNRVAHRRRLVVQVGAIAEHRRLSLKLGQVVVADVSVLVVPGTLPGGGSRRGGLGRGLGAALARRGGLGRRGTSHDRGLGNSDFRHSDIRHSDLRNVGLGRLRDRGGLARLRGRGRGRGRGGRGSHRGPRGPGADGRRLLNGGLARGLRREQAGLLVGQPDAGLSQLAENRAGLSWGQSCLGERGPQLREGQVALAATALDQVIHARRSRVPLVSTVGSTGIGGYSGLGRSGVRDPRHETPPSFCNTRMRRVLQHCAVQRRCLTVPNMASNRPAWVDRYFPRALLINASRRRLFPSA